MLGIVNQCTMRERLNLKFHTIMAEPFTERANCIEKNLAILKNKALSLKSLKDITVIEEKYNQIKKYSIPKIEKATEYKFFNQNLFLFVFLYQEITMVFNEAGQILEKSVEVSLTREDIAKMKEVSENRLTLAYIGDAVLEIGVLPSIWPPSDLTFIPRNDFLHNERGKVIENIPLSHFWDFLKLYDEKTLKQPPNENDENKGSSMEAVFGIIYLESGLEAVEEAIRNLKCNYKKNLL